MGKGKINYLIAMVSLYAVCLLGQILCDGLGYDHVLGRYLLNTVIFCTVCAGYIFWYIFCKRREKSGESCHGC